MKVGETASPTLSKVIKRQEVTAPIREIDQPLNLHLKQQLAIYTLSYLFFSLYVHSEQSPTITLSRAGDAAHLRERSQTDGLQKRQRCESPLHFLYLLYNPHVFMRMCAEYVQQLQSLHILSAFMLY